MSEETCACKRCGKKPEIKLAKPLYNTMCTNGDCPKPSQVGWFTDKDKSIKAWNRKQEMPEGFTGIWK